MNVNRKMVSAALATTAAALFATSAVVSTANAEEVMMTEKACIEKTGRG